MDEYYLDGEKYYFKNGEWLNASFITAPLAITARLNQQFIKSDNLEKKSVKELKELIAAARSSDNYILAEDLLEIVLQKADVNEIRNMLPRVTSNYRKRGLPQKAIDISKLYTEKYGRDVYSTALFTSIAAAYCDLENYDTARKFANLARKASNSNNNDELINVYKRIKRAENR